jgi:predicted Fe-Mo cluster-binding NifX family protein
MRICIPTATDQGIEAEVFGHFGSAPYFSLLDTDTAEVEVLGNDNQHHAHGQCSPMKQLSGAKFDAIVVRGMGRNAVARFAAANVPVMVTGARNLQDVLEEARSGSLRELDPAQACQGHGDRHGQQFVSRQTQRRSHHRAHRCGNHHRHHHGHQDRGGRGMRGGSDRETEGK